MLNDIRLQAFDFDEVCAGRIPNVNESLLQTCKLNENFLQQVLIPFELATGGYLSFIFWAVIALAVYAKYHNFILSALVGIPVLTASTVAFPDRAEMYISLLLILGVACAIMFVLWRVPRD